MQEKRYRKRFMVEEMDIHGKMIFATEVRVINISVGGISLRADRRLDIGSEYSLKLIDGEKTLALKGTVVWSSLSGHREGPRGDVVPFYTAGLKFANLVGDKEAALIDFIGEHLAGEEHRLGGLRVTITGQERAILNYPSAYLVKNLSLTGMLIESTQQIRVGIRLPMEMSLPDETPIRFLGRITSCHHMHEKGSDHFDVGIAFVNMEEKDMERLKDFVSLLRRMDSIS